MFPIPSVEALRAGDVLHHPAFGFATVDSVDGQGAALRWERAGPNHPARVSAAGLADAFRRCDSRGLLARSVESPDAARALLTREPVVAVALLLLDLGGRQRVQDLRDWLTERRLVGDARFEEWWGAVSPLVQGDPRFVLRRGALALVDGVTHESLAPSAPIELPGPGTLPATSALGFATRLARSLADAHAAGQSLAGDRSAVTVAGAGFRLRTLPARSPGELREDVRFVMRLVMEQVLGPLPSRADLADDDLVPIAASADPALPFELLAVAADALAKTPALRPADGLALLERLVVASAVHDLRAAMPHAPRAGIAVGFDTHIGMAKSLQGQTNQDTFLVLGDPSLALVGVADGISLSSAGSGDLASFLFARSIRASWDDHGASLADAPPAKVHAFLQDAVRRANKLICDQALRLAEGDLDRHIPMGTTALLALVRGNRVHLLGIGDSRAYVVGRFGVGVASTDANLQALRLRETLAGREVEWDEPRHALTSYAGHFTVDGKVEMPEVFTRTFTLLPDEWLLLATDGLSDYAADEEADVARVLAAATREVDEPSPTQRAMAVARSLVDAANRGGGGDNTTVLALTLSADDAADREDGPVPS